MVEILDSGRSLGVRRATADELLKRRLIYFCGEPVGVCCYVPSDEACSFYHIDRDRLESAFDVDFLDDDAGWRFLEQEIRQIEGRS